MPSFQQMFKQATMLADLNTDYTKYELFAAMLTDINIDALMCDNLLKVLTPSEILQVASIQAMYDREPSIKPNIGKLVFTM